MGRAKQYDRSQLLDRAISLFRRQGFHGTTTAQLVAALEVNRKSMYAEFGSKQGLFEAALALTTTMSLGSCAALRRQTRASTTSRPRSLSAPRPPRRGERAV